MFTKEKDMSNERSKLIRWLSGIFWFLLINTILILALAESVSFYVSMNYTGEEAVKMDRAISFELGNYLTIPQIIIAAIVVAKLSVKGILPGTKKSK